MLMEILVVGPLEVNCFVLGCQETREGIVVDAGGNAGEISAAVDRLGLKIGLVLNTHGHFDHIGANARIVDQTGAMLMIHEADAPLLAKGATVAMAYGINGENSPQPGGFLTDGMELTFGRCSLTVLHTPGHTQGGCCFYLAAEKKVITGDTLFAESIGRTDLPGGSHEQLLASIRTKLFTLPDEVAAYPGHGPATTIGHEKRHNPYF